MIVGTPIQISCCPYSPSRYTQEGNNFFLEIVEWLDARAIKKSAEQMKREYDKLKRKSSGK